MKNFFVLEAISEWTLPACQEMAHNLILGETQKSVKNVPWNTTAETIQLRCLTKRQDMESSRGNLWMNLFIYNNNLCTQ